MYDPIAYTYEADVHCPMCAYARFGAALDNADTTDSEGNTIGAIAPWDEQDTDGLYCGDCGAEIIEPEEPELRDYGRGKYDLMIDAAVHVLSLDGTCGTCGDCDALGYAYTRVDGQLDAAALPDGADLTRYEAEYLRAQVGAIVAEYDSGFVSVAYYTDADVLAAAWQACLAEVARGEHLVRVENAEEEGK